MGRYEIRVRECVGGILGTLDASARLGREVAVAALDDLEAAVELARESSVDGMCYARVVDARTGAPVFRAIAGVNVRCEPEA